MWRAAGLTHAVPAPAGAAGCAGAGSWPTRVCVCSDVRLEDPRGRWPALTPEEAFTLYMYTSELRTNDRSHRHQISSLIGLPIRCPFVDGG